ncbi:MAG: RdgB/HAM1 family non-canonical purine NTP pyrophosphatase [Oscillospiraceae bacterium]|nr:RdgB/HAM1 family non-canonical purine NTP pyrophosphatase [Oscillospiraceae bacterium]
MQLIIASNNAKKAAELHALLDGKFELLTLQQAGIYNVPEETGTTFRENALIKANAAHIRTGMPVVADDSGLCVDALGGAPGVYSAEYGSPQAVTDTDRNALLLKNMNNKDNRTCHFVSCLCLLLPNKPPIYFEGYCHGELLHNPRGNGGFGYDPLVYLPAYKKTMAELPSEVKNAISHRGQAMVKLKEYLL